MAAVPSQPVGYKSDTYRGGYDTSVKRGARFQDSASTVMPPANAVRGPQGLVGVQGPQGVGAELPEVADDAFTATVAATNLSGWTTRFSTVLSSLQQPLPPALDGGPSVRIGWAQASDITSLSLTAAGTDVIGDNSDVVFSFASVGDVVELQPVSGRWRFVSGQSNGAASISTPYGPTAGRPTASSVKVGFQWYDTTLHKPVWSDGTAWRDAAGTAV